MSGLEKSLFNLKFTAKQLNRQALKAGKDETAEKNKLKKAIQQNHPDIAKIYAQNAIRKQNEKLNLLRLGSRIDAVASRVQTAVTMRQVTGSMAGGGEGYGYRYEGDGFGEGRISCRCNLLYLVLGTL